MKPIIIHRQTVLLACLLGTSFFRGQNHGATTSKRTKSFGVAVGRV